MLVRRIGGGVIGPVRPYGDVGALEAVVTLHPYLHCLACGHRLHEGGTTTGASVLYCIVCLVVVDTRRIA